MPCSCSLPQPCANGPLQILHGTDDSYISDRSTKELLEHAGSKDKDIKIVQDGATYLLMDNYPIRKTVFGMVDDWLHKRTS